MKQRTALFIAGGLTAFVLVGLGVVIGVANAPQPTQAAGALPSSATVTETITVPITPSQDVIAALTPQRALQIALASVPGATATRLPELVDLQGTLAYEVTLDKGVVYVDANTGAVLYDGTAQKSASRGKYEHEGDEDEHESHDEHEDHEADEHEDKDEHDERDDD